MLVLQIKKFTYSHYLFYLHSKNNSINAPPMIVFNISYYAHHFLDESICKCMKDNYIPISHGCKTQR